MNTVYNENMVVLHIKDIMIKKNINRYQLSQMTGIKYDIITKYYNGLIPLSRTIVLFPFLFQKLLFQLNYLLLYRHHLYLQLL